MEILLLLLVCVYIGGEERKRGCGQRQRKIGVSTEKELWAFKSLGFRGVKRQIGKRMGLGGGGKVV